MTTKRKLSSGISQQVINSLGTVLSKFQFIATVVTIVIVLNALIFIEWRNVNIMMESKLLNNVINESQLIEFKLKYSGLNQKHHEWFRYRLGDMFRHANQAANLHWGYQYHSQHFPNSIATQYLSKSNGTKYDYSLLYDIVKNKTKENIDLIPSNDTLVIHLRTGDVIDGSTLNVNEMLTMKQPRKTYYVKGLPYYINILNKLKRYKLNKALFVTGFHFTAAHTNHNKSIIYIFKIIQFFEYNGYQTMLRINKNPDDDFILMCNSKYFAKSGGGFSMMIAKTVQLTGGNVLPCISTFQQGFLGTRIGMQNENVFPWGLNTEKERKKKVFCKDNQLSFD